MKHHETKNTVGTLRWCNVCKRQTIHAVSGKRVGQCTEHEASGMSKKQEDAAKKREEEARNPRMF